MYIKSCIPSAQAFVTILLTCKIFIFYFVGWSKAFLIETQHSAYFSVLKRLYALKVILNPEIIYAWVTLKEFDLEL